jgi:endonuclease/exonuclease/phosphatase family metal-dependent hydrolase
MTRHPIFSILFFFLTLSSTAQNTINVMTFNIRYDNPRDSQNAWPNRKDLVASQVLFHEVDVLGVQEALHHQLTELQQRLLKYKWFGVARDDGKEKGEYSPIFYDSTRFQLLEGKTFWLSENPQVVGKAGWDAALPRIVTWIKLKDRKSKKHFFVFNTHFDHVGQTARKQSAVLLRAQVTKIAGKDPVIIMGDFNAIPSSEPIQTLLDMKTPGAFTDSKAVSAEPHYGPDGTFNNFGSKETGNEPIDYIFVKKPVRVLKHATLSQGWNGRFSSDHFPVFAKLELY